MALQFEARKVALKQDRTGFVLTLSIHPDEIPVELLRDFVGARYGVAMVRIQDDESPMSYDNRVKKAGILCRSEDFHEFLDVKDEHSAAEKVCKYCKISSRSELNGNSEAQQLFDKLVDAFNQWSENNEPF